MTVMLTWCEAGRVSALARNVVNDIERNVCRAETQPCASEVPQKDLKDG